MKKLVLFLALIVSTAFVWGSNVITYTATQKLAETQDAKEEGILTTAFNVAIISHEFADGIGTITFAGEVTRIGDYAFYDNYYLKGIAIPNSVDTIGEFALFNNSLSSLFIPASVRYIGYRAIDDEIRKIEVDENSTYYKSIDGVLYDYDVKNLIKCPSSLFYNDTCVIPSTVEHIATHAFIYTNIGVIIFPEGLKSIGDCAFWGARNITSIHIPASVCNLSPYAFVPMYDLQQITVADGNSHYKVVDNVLYTSAMDTLIQYPLADTTRTSFVVPNTVKSIGRAFAHADPLCKITLSDHLEKIEYGAFTNSLLTYIEIPNSVTVIEARAFMEAWLDTIVLGSGVTQIGEWAIPVPTIISNAMVPPVCDGEAFDPDYVSSVQVPFGKAYLYKQAPLWEELDCYPVYPLEDTKNNDSTLTAWKDTILDVSINRTYFTDGQNNTLCLPFSLTTDQIDESPLAGYSKLQKYESAVIVNGGTPQETLELTMTDVTSIEAGQPYLIAWDEGEDIEDPVFEDAKITSNKGISTTKKDGVQFCSTFSPYQVEAGDKGILFVGLDGLLNWPNVGGSIKGFRCFFTVDLGTGSPIRRGMNARIGSGKTVPTGMINVNANANANCKMMVDGKFVIIRDGKVYNAQGAIVE